MTSGQMTSGDEAPAAVCEATPAYGLAERTAVFGERVLAFARGIGITSVTGVLVRQLVRSGTSVGANYLEADDADTRKDFIYRIGVCRREARETRYWLRMLASVGSEDADEITILANEALELTRIFAAIKRSALANKSSTGH